MHFSATASAALFVRTSPARQLTQALRAVFDAGGGAVMKRVMQAHAESAVLKENYAVLAPLLDEVVPLVAAEATTADELSEERTGSSARNSQRSQPARESKRVQSKRISSRATFAASTVAVKSSLSRPRAGAMHRTWFASPLLLLSESLSSPTSYFRWSMASWS